MGGGGVEPPGDILPGEDGDDPRNRFRLVAADAANARMSVRRSQHFEMQRPLDRDIERVTRLPGDDGSAKGVAQIRAAGVGLAVVFGLAHAMHGIADAAIAGAAAEIAFERIGQVLARLGVEAGGGHDHAGAAESALKARRIEKGLLHRVQLAVAREPFDGGDRVSGAAKSGDQAGVIGHAVEPHRAGAAIARVAPLLHAEEAELAQECPEALTGRRFRREGLAVYREVHGAARGLASSARICSAK